MTSDVENLVLEQLSAIRGELAALRDGQTNTSQRLDHIDALLNGLNYVVTASIGSFMADVTDLKDRVRQLEKT